MLRELYFIISLGAAAPLFARSVYLNGTDISSAFSQDLIKVDLEIDAKGNIFITAPHYSVHEEESFVPLSTAQPALPKHKTPKVIQRGENPTVPAVEAAEQLKSKKPASAPVPPPSLPASEEIPPQAPLEKEQGQGQK